MKNSNLKIYQKTLNNKLKFIPLNSKKNDLGKIKYFPSFSKEWTNIAYFFNKNSIKNISLYNIIINSIIRSYFNLFFKDNNKNNIDLNKKRDLLKEIYLSNAKIKFNNSIAIINLYTVNLRQHIFTKYINYFYYYSIEKEWSKIFDNKTQDWILTTKKPYALAKIFKEKYLKILGIETVLTGLNKKYVNKNSIFNNVKNIKQLLDIKLRIFEKSIISYNLYRKIYLIKEIKNIYYKYLIILYKYNSMYYYYNSKFSDENLSLVHKLKSKLSKILNKKIKLNIINLKSITYNTDIFTRVLAIKLKKRKFNIIKSMLTILNKGNIITNNISNTKSILKNKDLHLLENKHKDLSLISIIKSHSLNTFLNDSHFDKKSSIKNSKSDLTNSNIYTTIFENIKYKNMGGIRLEIKGRLTKRYRADRALYKLRWKGGLKNTDASFRRLSSIMYRGHLNSNLAHSINKSKRRIGSFAVKGWIGGN